jgi:hypothetical protein
VARSPVDLNTMPTPSNPVHAREAIAIFKNRLEEELPACLSICKCDGGIGRTEGLDAPVHRVSFDFLSIIFKVCSVNNRRASLVINGVS